MLLLEDRGHGYDTATTRTAASALQTMGCSAALVATLSSNVGGAGTYTAAGFENSQRDETDAGQLNVET